MNPSSLLSALLSSLLAALPPVLLLCVLAPPTALADCACQCMAGTPRTVCSTLAEARLEPSLCKQKMNCPRLSAEQKKEAILRRTYPAPEENATNCRNNYFWDPNKQEYNILAKVCDLVDSEAGTES